jgi:hypothetical protein
MFEMFANTGMPGLGSIGEGYQRKADLKRQRKEMEVAAALEIMASKKQARKMVGSYVSDVGASGVDLTLDEIGEVNKEYALDQAITFDYAQRQSDLMRTAGNKAVTAGYIKAGLEITDILLTGGKEGIQQDVTPTETPQVNKPQASGFNAGAGHSIRQPAGGSLTTKKQWSSPNSGGSIRFGGLR